jgi:hypothetical protein
MFYLQAAAIAAPAGITTSSGEALQRLQSPDLSSRQD